MKKRKRLLIFVGLAVMLFAGYATLRLTAPPHRITPVNIAAIRKGMTEREIENILGAPAGDYASAQASAMYQNLTYHVDEDGKGWNGYELVKKWGGKVWVAEEGFLWVRFDDAGKVAETARHILVQQPESFLAKLRRWLGM